MNFLIYNGRIFSRDEFVFTLNRAMNYGDGLFETIRLHNGEILFFEDHFDRMIQGMNALKIEVPGSFSLFFFHKQIIDLCHRENIGANARIRIGIFRSGRGLYEPLQNGADYFMEIIPMEKGYEWNDIRCEAGLFTEVPKNFSSVSFFKSMNALPYVMAAIFRKEKNIGDCLLINSFGKIADAISSNVFWIESGKVFTPPAKDGGVEGVMRKNLVLILKKNEIRVIERSITPSELIDADELFLTNTGWGIKPVAHFEHTTFSTGFTKEIFQLLQKNLENLTRT